MDFSRRIDIPELMDSTDVGEAELRSALRFISATNRWLGGSRVILDHLRRWSRDWFPGETVTFLDVGTGDADIPIAIAKWGRTQGFRFKIKAIDSTPLIASIAERNAREYPEITVGETDFFSLNPAIESFDYVMCSLVLHHLPQGRLVEALNLCDQLSRRGVVIGDLSRSQLAFLGVKVLTLLGNRIVRNDGPLSVRRSFTPEELSRLAQQAHLGYLRARPHSFFRLSLAGQKASK